MWHQKRRRRLGLETEHRLSLIRNLSKELVAHHRVITTIARAKEAAKFTEKLITLAKKKTLHSRRRLIAELGSGSETVAKRLIDIVAPKFADRQGGYTRVLHYQFRKGDGAQLALLEFSIPVFETEKKKRKSEKKKKIEHPAEKEEKHTPSEKPSEKDKAKPEKEEKPVTPKETAKKGGFLSGLRKFITGKEE